MWQDGGSSGSIYDDPDDFDAEETGIRNEKLEKETVSDGGMKVVNTNTVTINLNIGQGAMDSSNIRRGGDDEELMEKIKQIMNTRSEDLKAEIQNAAEDRTGRMFEQEEKKMELEVKINDTLINIVEGVGGDKGDTEAGDVKLVIVIVLGCLIVCIIIVAVYLRYRNRPPVESETIRKHGREEGWLNRMWQNGQNWCCKREQSGQSTREPEESGYLTPINTVSGIVYTSTVAPEDKGLGEEAKQEKIQKVRTGLENANFVYGYAGMREEEGIYEDINCESSEVLGKKIVGKVALNEPPKSSAKIGITISSDKPYHTYVNIEESDKGQEEGSGLDVGDINKKVTAQIHVISEEREKNSVKSIDGDGNDRAASDDGKPEEEGLKDEKDEGMEKGNKLEYSNNENDTVISDSFAENVRQAIEEVEKERFEGDERLERVLESLEEGMRREREEGEQIDVRIKHMSEDTPRRSARLVEKQSKLAKENNKPKKMKA